MAVKMCDRITEVLRTLTSLGQNRSLQISGLIMMGSFGDQSRKNVTDCSDLDILVLTNNAEDCRLKLASEIENQFGSRMIGSFETGCKLVVYLEKPLLKIDLAFAAKMHDYARYLRGSEQCSALWDGSPGGNLAGDLQELMGVTAAETLPEYKFGYHVTRFVEHFELLCKSFHRKDQYRVEFYGFIIRNSLVCMESILAGVKQHLYLPKNAFAQGGGVVKSLPTILGDTMDDGEQFLLICEEYCKVYCDFLRRNAEETPPRKAEEYSTLLKAFVAAYLKRKPGN